MGFLEKIQYGDKTTKTTCDIEEKIKDKNIKVAYLEVSSNYDTAYITIKNKYDNYIYINFNNISNTIKYWTNNEITTIYDYLKEQLNNLMKENTPPIFKTIFDKIEYHMCDRKLIK